jgi:hypothetical protein
MTRFETFRPSKTSKRLRPKKDRPTRQKAKPKEYYDENRYKGIEP